MRFAARVPGGLGALGGGEELGTVGDDAQLDGLGRFWGGKRPANGPATGAPAGGADWASGFAGPPPGLLMDGTAPVEAAWFRDGGAPCREREKAFILARIS